MLCPLSEPPGFFDSSFFLLCLGAFGLIIQLAGWLSFASIRRSFLLVKQRRRLLLLEWLGTVFGAPGILVLAASGLWWAALGDWRNPPVDNGCLNNPDLAAYGQAVSLCLVLIVLGAVFGVGGIVLVVYSRLTMKRLARSIETP